MLTRLAVIRTTAVRLLAAAPFMVTLTGCGDIGETDIADHPAGSAIETVAVDASVEPGQARCRDDLRPRFDPPYPHRTNPFVALDEGQGTGANPRMRLVAISRTDTAVATLDLGGEPRTVREGDRLGEWAVARIGRASVEFDDHGTRRFLTLD